jgi:hypothetical protein
MANKPYIQKIRPSRWGRCAGLNKTCPLPAVWYNPKARGVFCSIHVYNPEKQLSYTETKEE